MDSHSIKSAAIVACNFLFMAGTLALAQSPASPPAAPSLGELLQKMLPMFAIVFLIFYFLVLKPQQDKVKNQQALLGALKRGDVVVTSSGIIARVISVEADHVLLDISTNVKIKLERSHIAKKLEKNEGEKGAAS